MTNPTLAELPPINITPAIAYAVALSRSFAVAYRDSDGDPDYDFSTTPAEDVALIEALAEGRAVAHRLDVHRLCQKAEQAAGRAAPSFDDLSWIQEDRYAALMSALELAARLLEDPQGYARGAALLQTCLEQATVFPALHAQESWFRLKLQTDADGHVTACGSTGCLAGHAVVLGSDYVPSISEREVVNLLKFGEEVWVQYTQNEIEKDVFPDLKARRLLFLSDREADLMFSEFITLDGLWELAEVLFPGLVVRPGADRLVEIEAAGPLVVFTKVGVRSNGIVALDDLGSRYLR